MVTFASISLHRSFRELLTTRSARACSSETRLKRQQATKYQGQEATSNSPNTVHGRLHQGEATSRVRHCPLARWLPTTSSWGIQQLSLFLGLQRVTAHRANSPTSEVAAWMLMQGQACIARVKFGRQNVAPNDGQVPTTKYHHQDQDRQPLHLVQPTQIHNGATCNLDQEGPECRSVHTLKSTPAL
jgi:hypothetical protein